VAPWVISVGATDNSGKLADFSSRGEFGSRLFRPTLVAPGVNTVSLRPSTVASVTSVSGLLEKDLQFSPSEFAYYTTGSGTSFSAPQVAGAIALMLEANPQLTPAQIRDILQRTATPLPPYYLYEVGAGMLNAQAAVLEAAFPQRHFGGWRGAAFQNQVEFSQSAPQTFTGSVAPGTSSDSVISLPPDTLRASVQVAWGLSGLNNLNLALVDAQGIQQSLANVAIAPGLTGRRQRSLLNAPPAGNWTVRVSNVVGAATAPLTATSGNVSSTQAYFGTVQVTTARYVPLADLGELDSVAAAEVMQNFRSLVLSPIGSRFRPSFPVTRVDLARALVLGGRLPQYLPAQSSFSDVSDRSTMLFVESAQASPNGALFPAATGTFQPDVIVDRLTAVVALVRAAGLRQAAETGSYTLTYTDTLAIPASMRGYVSVAVQNGLIKPNGMAFNPQGTFTRLDLSRAMARLAAMNSQ